MYQPFRDSSAAFWQVVAAQPGHKYIGSNISHACIRQCTLYGHVWALQGFRHCLLASHCRSTWAPHLRVICPVNLMSGTISVHGHASCRAQSHTTGTTSCVLRGSRPCFRYDFRCPAGHKPLIRYDFWSCVLWGTLPRSRYNFVRPAGHKPLVRYDFRSCVLRGSSHASGTTSGCVLRGTRPHFRYDFRFYTAGLAARAGDDGAQRLT
jgi:hypothetical protein